ncbi:MAG: type II toxin-antitoxin system VapC family toxin [Xenococcaceae cyanobacterium MO_207.B15]|nr:type II toxin-antitoxin system VapC family toxin [Xenococcaceae cyanobacterium MO_207.B15]
MNTLLLDTDVVSFILKGDSRANKYASIVQGNRLALSFMTVAELFQWAAIRNWGKQRVANLEKSLTNYLIIPVDIEVCRIWGNLRAKRQAIGRVIAPQDAWIAATAIRHNLPLVTNNAKDFKDIPELKVLTVK